MNEIEDTDEIILMEAVTLAGLDIDFVKPCFDKESNEKYMKKVREKRLPLFITDYSKNKFEKLYKMREKYYQNKN